MEYRELGRTGWKVSAISFGAWAIGGTWGPVQDRESLAALNRAVDLGVNLFDTADVYGDGRSERLLAQLKRERKEDIHIVTKAGRRLDPHVAAGYNRQNLTAFVERSLKNLDADTIDLVQLHCPPTEVYYRPDLFAALDELVADGSIAAYGVSVERVEEALKAVEYAGVACVQVIYNLVRQRPADRFLAEAARRDVGVLARVPLASGLLTGKLTRETAFGPDDHRAFNRHGESFDVGETFAGLDYETGLELVEELRALVPDGATLAQLALRWILMADDVTAAIPGAKTPEQARANAAAADLAALPPATMERIRELYEVRAKPLVHQRW